MTIRTLQARLHSIPQLVAVAAAAMFTAVYFAAALPRVLYPYDLDFLEDSVLMECVRFANNQPVYIAPNAIFNPHVYTPLYFWLGGLLFQLAGPSLLALRSLSLGATVATAIAIYWIARRESRVQWIAVSCAGLFLGGYAITGFWYELARVDALFVALTVWGLGLAVYAGGSKRQMIISAGLLALATLTKQTGLAIGAGMTVYLLIRERRRALWFAVVFGTLTIVPALVANALTNGWFFYHILYIGTADPTEVSRLVSYFADKIFGVMAGLSLMTILSAIFILRSGGRRAWMEAGWFVAIGLAVAVSGLARMRVGGNLNDLMPAYTLLCLAPALLFRHFAPRPLEQSEVQEARPLWFEFAMAGIILGQFALGAYAPAARIPTSAMSESGQALIEQIASVNGPVLVMMHPYYALRAGKDTSTQIATMWYVRHRGELPLPGDFVDRIRTQYYAEIISDQSSFETEDALRTVVNNYYFPARALSADQAPATNTGVVVRPSLIYLPRSP